MPSISALGPAIFAIPRVQGTVSLGCYQDIGADHDASNVSPPRSTRSRGVERITSAGDYHSSRGDGL